MARYKPVERGGMLIPVVMHEQIQSGTFEFTLNHLVDHELGLSECARPSTRSTAEGSTASASQLWGRCLPISATTST